MGLVGCQLTLFFIHAAIYFNLMSLKYKKCVIRIIGVALEGQQGLPVVVFDDPESGDFITVSVDPFNADILIRDYVGEADSSAAAWLGNLLESRHPLRGIINIGDEGTPRIQFEFGVHRPKGLKRNLSLPLGEGLILARRLSLPLYAEERLFDSSRDELLFLNREKAFGRDFLYLTPPQFASDIPLE